MKPSSYNYDATIPDGTTLFFNFFTLHLVALDRSDADLAKRILKHPDEPFQDKAASELKKLLVEKGFLIGDAISEIDHLKKAHYLGCNQSKTLSLTILPSLACNFRCTYCYENKDSKNMGPKVEEALISFIKSRLQQKGGLTVTWFGGEPLLQMGIIERLSEGFMAICEERGCKYSADVITNGYLLTEETAERLVELKVKRAQVTLDGPPQIHDQRRPKSDGGGTFFQIFENLKNVPRSLPVTLRINVDQNNRDHVVELIDMLEEAGVRESAHPYLGRAYPYTEVCSDVSSNCLTDEDFSLFELEIEMALSERGFSSFRLPKARNFHCLADNNNAFVITPSGAVVNCWNDASNPSAAIGHLLKPFTQEMQKNAEKWGGRNPFELECADCLLLPICMGGCPYLFLRTGKLQCHDWKHHLDASLAFYYYLKQMEYQGKIAREFHNLVSAVKEFKASEPSGSLPRNHVTVPPC